MKVGDLLLPNEYQIRNPPAYIGVVVEVKHFPSGFPPQFRVFLNNGITHWMNENTITDLFDVIPT